MVAIDKSGNVWVGESGNNRSQKFNASGSYVTQIGVGSTGLATDSSSNLWVGDYSGANVGEVSSSGSYIGAFSTPDIVNGVSIDSSGNIYTGEHDNRIFDKWNTSGSKLLSFGSAGTGNGHFGNGGPGASAIDSSGNIWIVDQSNNRVQEFNSSGSYITQLCCASGSCSVNSGNGQCHSPSGVAVDSSNNVWIVDQFNYRVQIFNSAGSYQSQFGSCCVGNNQFNVPNNIAIGR
jgi:sugar lactone lactonase YvrE